MTEELNDYILSHISPEPDDLRELERDVNVRLLYPRMCSGHLQGRILKMLTSMIAPKRVIELGTYAGYSALSIAEGLAEDAEIHTIEADDEMEEFIRRRLDRSPHGHKVHLHIGPAEEVIPTLPGGWDMAFIDANKRSYVDYYEAILPRMNPGGYILADNTLWGGKVADPSARDTQTLGIRAFKDLAARDPRVETVILPLRDGLTMIHLLE
ncbi:MAG: O-methyltransferase [Muribaculaceae bacterium]|nr:O-methyltransferase [Muribaculaceae bacterium]